MIDMHDFPDFYLIIFAMVCVYLVKHFPAKTIWNGMYEKLRSKECDSVNTGKDATIEPTLKIVQRRFRDLVNEIDTKNFQGDLVEFRILSTEFFHSLKKLSRRERAEILLLKLFMSPKDWIPIFMKTLQQKYKKSYLSIVNLKSNEQGVSNERKWSNLCTRKIIKYIINDSMQNAKVPLDAGKLIPSLFEGQVIMPRHYEEIMMEKCLSKRTEKLLNILDDDYTDGRCLDIFKQAIIDAGYEECHCILEKLMSDYTDCDRCNGHIPDSMENEKPSFGDLRERKLSGYHVSSTYTAIGDTDKKEKTIIFKFAINTKSEDKHDEIVREFNARKESLNKSIGELGEVVSISKGCLAIVVRSNHSDSSYGDIAIEILNRMLSGNLPWDVLDKGDIKVQICVTDFPKGEDSKLIQDKISLLRHVPAILEEMDALDFEEAFSHSGLIRKDEFWKMFDIDQLGRQERMLRLLQFILKDDRPIYFENFINVIRESFNNPLVPQTKILNRSEGEKIDTIQKQSTFGYDNYTEDQTKQYVLKEKVPVIPKCYSMFAALLRQRKKNERMQTFLIRLVAVIGLVALACSLALAIQNVNNDIKRFTTEDTEVKTKGKFSLSEIYFTNFSVDRQQQLTFYFACFPSFPQWIWSVCFTNNTDTESYLIQNNCTNEQNVSAESNKIDLTVIGIIIIIIVVVVCVIVSSRNSRFSIRRTKEGKCCTDYDAFIAYADRDREWVLENVLKLEKKYNLKLCIPDRDFSPGEYIVRSIFESIQKSKSIIVLVSQDFIEDVWSHFIMDVAQCLIIERSSKNRLLVLRSEEDMEFAKMFPYSLWTVIRHDKTTGSESGSVWENVAKILVSDPEKMH